MLIIFGVYKTFVNVVVDVGGSLKCFEMIRVNIDEVQGKGNRFSSKIREEMECGNGSM